MADYKLPEPEDEFVSGTKPNYSKTVAAHVKDFTGKIRLANTIQRLDALKRDIIRSDLANNFPAKEELRRAANARAKELGFKGGTWWN
ncbi:hypothetical protein HY969_03645 [Candidatus Kaiserbacteria bacterium]|nr:hypothetical protein [Candidatus Kaiserbacteria bacterium]